MSEQFPLFDEQAEHSPNDEYIDVRNTDEWEDFLSEMHAAEKAMLIYQDPTDDHACDIAAKRACDLTEAFGDEYTSQPSRVLGLAYHDDNFDTSVVLDARRATFLNCDLRFIDGQWRTTLEFYTDGTDNDMPQGSYYMPVDKQHILELKIQADFHHDNMDITAVQLLHEQADAAQELVISADFLALPADAQRQTLEKICASADSELPPNVRSQSVAIDCERYYSRYDEMPGFAIRDFMTDGSTSSEENQFLLPQGFITSFDYPEIDSFPPNQTLTAWNFDIGAGAPCLVVRNDMESVTHYIPTAGIKDLI